MAKSDKIITSKLGTRTGLINKIMMSMEQRDSLGDLFQIKANKITGSKRSAGSLEEKKLQTSEHNKK